MKKVGFIVLSVAMLMAVGVAHAEIIEPPPPPVDACEQDEYKNHGEYVSCVAQNKDLRGPGPGNSSAAHSEHGKK